VHSEVSPGYRLIALDAKTGTLVSKFGENGAVDLKLNDDQTIFPDRPEWSPATP